MKLAATIIGYVAICVSIMIYQQKNRRKLLIWKASADAVWIIHYLLLGAYTGAAITGITLARGLVFLRCERRSKLGKIFLVCFLCISITSSILTWGGIFSIFALMASLMAIISFWIGEPKLSRIMAFPISTSMLIYGVSAGSVAALINETLAMVSAAIGIVRNRQKTVQ